MERAGRIRSRFRGGIFFPKMTTKRIRGRRREMAVTSRGLVSYRTRTSSSRRRQRRRMARTPRERWREHLREQSANAARTPARTKREHRANCRAVIITLGLVEVWRDARANVFINNTPIQALLGAQPNRYEFHVTSFAENWSNLEAIHAVLSRYGHPDVRIVVTVSPVPLTATFSTTDVVTANTYSKSLLRAIAHEWAAAHENVDYFPSYEIVQNSDRASVWQPDLTHVKGPGLRHIIDLFLQSYLS